MRHLLLLLGIALLPSTALQAQDSLALLEEQAMRAAVARIAPSVVRIETIGGLERVGEVLVGTGPTTGLVVSADGYVLSSAFNFAQQPSSILVTTTGGKRSPARVVARDRARMLVLLKVNTAEPLTVPEIVPREEMVVGQWTIAVGRTFPGEAPNLSVGILSATHRIWNKCLQSDAKISPNNYGGPLVDIRGRVLGVLVPMSPRGSGEMAGAEWYDSGIGFAVPLADIIPRLETLKAGTDLVPGLLGISLKGTDIYALPAEIAAVRAKSPAYEGGFRAGDVITRIDDTPIERQAHLKHALGPKYAGDAVRITARRGDETVEAEVTLVDELIPYEHPFLGILPLRGAAAGTVRYVYADSAAARAGLRPGDCIRQVGESAVESNDGLRLQIANNLPGDRVTLTFERGGESRQAEIELDRLPEEIPSSLPPAAADPPPQEEAAEPQLQVVEVQIPEEANKCVALVPGNYNAQTPHGLLVWLHAPGKFDQQRLQKRWATLCAEQHLIVLAPQSADPSKWEPTEVEFIRKTMDDVIKNYTIAPTRIVVHGYQAGGSMAYLTAFRYPDLVRGAAVVDATIPRRSRLPETDPVQRLAVYSAAAAESPMIKMINAGLQALRDGKHPVTARTLDANRYLTDEELQELARWIDTLDRI